VEARSGREYYQVNVTTPSRDEAGSLGQVLVESRLAACAQVSGPISSTYWWDGHITSASEWLCTLKTTSDRLESLMATVHEMHSYDVPEIIAIPIIAGHPLYLAWIDEETRA